MMVISTEVFLHQREYIVEKEEFLTDGTKERIKVGWRTMTETGVSYVVFVFQDIMLFKTKSRNLNYFWFEIGSLI